MTAPVVAALRDLITAVDERIVADVNTRLQLVAELRDRKAEQGIAFLDPEREAWLVAHLRETNEGPLSDDGVERLLEFVLKLVKDELDA